MSIPKNQNIRNVKGFVTVYPVGVLEASVKVWKPDKVGRHNKEKESKTTPKKNIQLNKISKNTQITPMQ